MTTKSSAMPPHRVHRGRVKWNKYLIWLVLGLGSVVMIGPFYWTLITSFKPQREIFAFPPTWWPAEPTLDNWLRLGDLDVGSFPVFFRNSLVVASTITLTILLTSTLAGYVFAKINFKGRDLIFWFVLALLVVPFSVTLVPSYNLMVRLGLDNSYWALILPIAYSPFGIFLMRQFIQTIPTELLEAARIDGASEFRIFFRIIIPLSAPALAALGILTFIQQWDSFLWPLVILRDIDKYTLPLGLAQFRGQLGVDVGGLSAASMVAVIPMLIVFIVAQRRFIEGITLSGLKG
jgi:multiple sugar transport system permease protein